MLLGVSPAEIVNSHKGHDVVCERCGLLATDFVDYAKSLRDNRPELYNRNKCWCSLPSEFYCNDCKEKLSTA